ncbi:TIR-like protein FxsC [Dactylosporangium sp. CA-092794]|uniref:TIR-like protein FxsC n=1 Tax=Dactylosporangium sp. CA-092794 TaxID=3239929 RepID=UPI003D901924
MTAPAQDPLFFLSYARPSLPAAEMVANDRDYWVRKFFTDLGAAVESHAERRPGLGAGFFAGLLAPGVDLRLARAGALDVARVFVPLYAPLYFVNDWALGERRSFQQRLAGDGLSAAAVARRIVPVLWTPLPPWESRPELDVAREILTGTEAEGYAESYAQNGLRMMCQLDAYEEQYRAIVRALAGLIVRAAAAEAGGPEAAPRDVATEAGLGDPAAGQSVAATPDPLLRVGVLPPSEGSGWHPYEDIGHALPVARYVAETAERLGVSTEIVELAGAAPIRPGPLVVLVDGTADGAALRPGIAALPPWAVPVILPGERGAPPRAGVLDILRGAKLRGAETVRHLDQLDRFVSLAVFRARNQYLKQMPKDRKLTDSRPSLRSGAGAEEPPRTEEDR